MEPVANFQRPERESAEWVRDMCAYGHCGWCGEPRRAVIELLPDGGRFQTMKCYTELAGEEHGGIRIDLL